MDRAHRIGQTKTVNVFKIVTKNTIEERIISLQNIKIKMANTIINDSNSDLNKMKDNDVMDVFCNNNDINELKSQKRSLSNLEHQDFENYQDYDEQFDLKKFNDNLN